MKNEEKFVMINAASKALDYKNKHPFSSTEEIIKKVIGDIEAEQEIKILAVASANEVLSIRAENLKLSNKQIMQKFVDNMKELAHRVNPDFD